MYLARQRIRGKPCYFIRESYKEGDCFRSRELFDLGTNPARYIVYPGGNAFYIDEVVEDTLCSLGVTGAADKLEDVFWPFVKPGIRRVLEPFRHRGQARRKKRSMTPEEEAESRRQLSNFDKRRIHYLRSGRMDQGGLGRMSVLLLRWLFGKSRDEIEQRFMTMERSLGPRDLKNYTFVIFDLQKYFTQSWAKKIPQGLPQDEVDEHFLEEICRLNRDASFWAGEEHSGDMLHEYLVRYVVMFFDHPFGEDTFLRDHIKEFMDSHRAWRFPERTRTMGMDEASAVFGVDKEILRSMSKQRLVRLFRRLAQKRHPDKGGTHEEFIRLTEAYRECLRRKGG